MLVKNKSNHSISDKLNADVIDNNNYISLAQAGKYSRYSQEYLSLRARQGKMKAVKQGRNWVTTKEWVKEYEKKFSDDKEKFVSKLQKKIGNIKLSDTIKQLWRSKAFAVVAITVFLISTVAVATRGFNADSYADLTRIGGSVVAGAGNIGKAAVNIVADTGEVLRESYLALAETVQDLTLHTPDLSQEGNYGSRVLSYIGNIGKGGVVSVGKAVGGFGKVLGESYIGLADEMVKVAGSFGEALDAAGSGIVADVKYTVAVATRGFNADSYADLTRIGGSVVAGAGNIGKATVNIVADTGEALRASYLAVAETVGHINPVDVLSYIGSIGKSGIGAVGGFGKTLGESYIGLMEGIVDIAGDFGESLNDSQIQLVDGMYRVSMFSGNVQKRITGDIKYRGYALADAVVSGTQEYYTAIRDYGTIAVVDELQKGSTALRDYGAAAVGAVGGFGKTLGESYIGLADEMVKVAGSFGESLKDAPIQLANGMYRVTSFAGDVFEDYSNNYILAGIYNISDSWKNLANNLPKDKADFVRLVEGRNEWRKLADSSTRGLGDKPHPYPSPQRGGTVRSPSFEEGERGRLFGLGGEDALSSQEVAGALVSSSAIRSGAVEKESFLSGLWKGAKSVLDYSDQTMGSIIDGFGGVMGSVVDGMDRAMALVMGGRGFDHADLAGTGADSYADRTRIADEGIEGDEVEGDEGDDGSVNTKIVQLEKEEEEFQISSAKSADQKNLKDQMSNIKEREEGKEGIEVVEEEGSTAPSAVVDYGATEEEPVSASQDAELRRGEEEWLALAGGTVTGDLIILGTSKTNKLEAEEILNKGILTNQGVAMLNGGVSVSSGLLKAGTSDSLNQVLVNGGLQVTGTTQLADTVITGNTVITGQETVNGNIVVNGRTTTNILDVTGNANILSLNVIGHAQVSSLGIAGTLGVDSISANKSLYVGQNATIGGASSDELLVRAQGTFTANVDAQDGLDVTGSNFTVGAANFIVDNSGNLTMAGDLSVGGTSSSTGAVSFNGDFTIGNEDSDIFTVRAGDWRFTSTATNTVAMTNGINFDSNTFVIDPISNRVGIGTSSPANLLHIASSDGNQMRLGYDGQNYTLFDIGSDGAFTMTPTNTGTTTIAHGLVVNTNSLVVQDATGNVGIGTTSPDVLLTIGDGSDNPYIKLYGDDGGTVKSATIQITSSGWFTITNATDHISLGAGNNNIYLASDTVVYDDQPLSFGTNEDFSIGYQNGNDYLQFIDNSTLGTDVRMVIDNAGNIGIATTAPLTTLSLEGTAGTPLMNIASSTGAPVLYVDEYDRVGIGTTTPWATLAVHAPAGENSFVIGSSTATSFVVDENGNVGIGTAGPGANLHLRSSDTRTTFFVDRGQDDKLTLSADTGNKFYIGTEDYDDVIVIDGTGATDNTLYLKQGLVGIGTTTPNHELSVYDTDGDAAISFGTGSTAGSDRWVMGVDYDDQSKFKIASSTALGSSDRFVIDGNGNIGIGDTTPDQLLEMLSSGAANTQFSIGNTNAGDYDVQLGFELADGTNTFTMGIDDSDSDKFKISGSALGTNDILSMTTASAEFGVPVTMAGAGDVSMAYDLYFTNPTAGYIKFDGPGYIQTSSAWQNLDLTLSAANSGFVVVDDTLQINTASTATTGATEYGSKLTLTDTGVVTTGTDTTYGNYNSITRTGATGGTIDTYGIYSDVTGDTGGTSSAIGGYFSAASADNNYGLLVANGLVGIGTTSPLTSLSLEGTAGTALMDIASSTGGSVLYVDEYGNVGIGTAAPGAKLEISDTGSVSLDIVSDSDANSGDTDSSIRFLIDGPIGTGTIKGVLTYDQGLDVMRLGYETSNSDLVIDNSGNVGIGTTSPLTSLSVEGTAGTALFNIASSTGAPIFYVDEYDKVGIGTGAPLANLHVRSATSGQGSVHANQDELILENSGSSGLTILSGTSNYGTLAFGDSGDADIGYIQYDHSDNSLSFGTNTSKQVYIKSDGTVGISTTTPSSDYKLDVYGDLRVGTAGADNIDYTFVTDVANGRVGIGTTTPTYELSLGYGKEAYFGGNVYTGSMEFDADAGLITAMDMPVSATPADNTVEGYNFAVDGKDILTVYAQADSSGAVDNMRIGIGTTTPLSRLSVQGETGISDLFTIASSTGANLLTVDRAGQVGIGTGVPGYKLEVNGDAKIVNQLGIGVNPTTAGAQINPLGDSAVGLAIQRNSASGRSQISLQDENGAEDWRIGMTAAGGTAFKFYDQSQDVLTLEQDGDVYFQPNGNVGIGTTSPLTSLSVEGTAGTALMDIASSTGGSVLYVDEYDRVGIGTDAPDSLLYVNSTDNPSGKYLTSIINLDPTTAESYGLLVRGGANADAGIEFLVQDYSGNTDFLIDGHGNVGIGGDPGSSKLYVGGNVGIGTTTPTSLLQVAGATAPKLTISDTDATTDQKHWFMESDTGSFSIGTTSDALVTNTTYRALSIDSSGDVGIGSSTPESQLAVQTSDSETALTVRQDGAGNVVEFKDGATTVFSINGSGNLTVGEGSRTVEIVSANWEIDTTGTATGTIDLSSAALTVTYKPESVSLIPEYPNSVYYADGGNNAGTLTSDYDSTNYHNYYRWTTAGDNQDYDIVVRWLVPEDFNGFDTSYDFKVYNRVSDVSGNTSVTYTMLDTANAAVSFTGEPITLQNAAWTETTVEYSGSPTFDASTSSARKWITFQIKLTADNGDTADIGEISFRYNREQ